MKQLKSEGSAENTTKHKSKLMNCDRMGSHCWKKVELMKNMQLSNG